MECQPKDSKLKDLNTQEGSCADTTENGDEQGIPCTLQEELKVKQRESDDYKNKWLRAQADFENYRKRMQKEMAESCLYATEPLAKDLLQVMDNFERGLSCFENGQDPMYKGVYLIYQQLKNLLEKYSITEIDALNKPFDPYFHDAVMTEESDDHEEGTVVEVFQKGYLYNSKVIRPSMVKVSKK